MLTLFLLAACNLEQPAPVVQAPPPGATPREAPVMAPPGADQGGVVPDRAPRLADVTLEPTLPKTTDPVRALVDASDPDGDQVDLDYLWILNGQERPDLTDDTLPPDETRKGDKVAVKVTASDGQSDTSLTSSETLVGNSAPTFLRDPRAASQIDGLVVQAEDVDADPLKFSISGAPAGMAIDAHSGRISYQGSEDEVGGPYQISVKVEDGDGGDATWSFGIQVSPGSAAVAKQKAEEAAANGEVPPEGAAPAEDGTGSDGTGE